MPPADPHLPCDEPARALAASLLRDARHAALAVTDPITGTPGISRIALCCPSPGRIMTLISALSVHTAAIRAQPACAFMVGDPPPDGDPLTHPRLMIQAIAHPLPRNHPDHAQLRTAWLDHHPKARLYVDFADFQFVLLQPAAALLNAGFGRAYLLTPLDLPH